MTISMVIKNFGQDEWNGIVSKIDTLSLMQMWEYGEAKALKGQWKPNRVFFYKKDEVVGAAQAMIRKVPFTNRGLVWINRAPIIKKKYLSQPEVHLSILKELKKYWVSKKNMYLRIAPPLIACDQNYKLFEKAGYFRSSETDGWESDIINLSLPLEELRKGLMPKWRGHLCRAERLGVCCEIGISDILIEELLNDYKVLLSKVDFSNNFTPDHVRVIQNLLPDSRKMLIFAGRLDGKKLGSILIVTYGDVCMYLIGAVNSIGKKVNANRYLIWQTVCEMKKRGYRWFDLGGVNPNKTTPGILDFKRGMRGEPYKLMGEVEAYRDGFLNKMIRKRIESSR